MSLSRVSVTAVRNLHPVTFSPSPRINILYGANGSGKTSVLEAIHLLGLARSFRSTRLLPVIQYEQLACTVFGQVEEKSLEIVDALVSAGVADSNDDGKPAQPITVTSIRP